MIVTLKSPLDRYTHVLHLADIHIRLNKRHDEYKEVFAKLYDEISKTPLSTIVAVLGDTFHNKSELSPECIQMASDLFKNIANIRPLILVAGNHDATLANKHRLDSLTPIVDALNNSNIFYLKDTGLYSFGNVLFNNMGVFDPPEKYMRGNDIPAIYRNQHEHVIALFHGPIDGAATDIGFKISNPAIMPPLFDYHDLVLLGDIHKKQDMQEYDPANHKPCIHYCGSTIQQNHGEDLQGHGYSLWDLSNYTYTHHGLENDYGYFTIEIHGGQLATDIRNIPKKTRLRVKCYGSTVAGTKSVISALKLKHEIIEIAYLRMDQELDSKKPGSTINDIVLSDLTVVSYQETLISEFLEKKLNLKDKAKIDKIIEINKNTNLTIKKDEFPRNLRWKPIRFEFDNMFTYGEGNVIDFTQMEGLYGIFGPNKSGKSSLLSAMTFCLFDKFDRGFKGLFVRNSQKTTFKCKFEIEISGVRYFIERIGDTTKAGNVTVSVKFWRKIGDVEEELHGTARRNTDEIIRDYIGTYEDYVLTTLSVQSAKNNISFIDMGNTERKDLLVQFIGLNVFDRLFDVASERNKELNVLLKMHKDQNYIYDKSQLENSLAQLQSLFSEKNRTVDGLHTQLEQINGEIINETARLIKLEDGIPTNLQSLESKRNSITTSIPQKNNALAQSAIAIQLKKDSISKLQNELETIEKLNLNENYTIYKKLLTNLSTIKQSMALKKAEIQSKFDKVARLKNHKYDPNCKFCTDNEFVKDAMTASAALELDKVAADKLLQELNLLLSEIDKFKWTETTYENYTKILTTIGKLKDELVIMNQHYNVLTSDLEKLNASLLEVNNQVNLYNRNDVAVIHNNKINSNIAAYRISHTRLSVDFKNNNRELMDINGKITSTTTKIKELAETIKHVKELEDEFELYQYYIKSVGRDGIPYQVICNAVPEIEKEVNSILSQIVEYTIEFETDGKNIVPYIVYDQNRKWPIEMSSGFERFIASIAIRVALTEISNLPRCNNLQIDEGFGVLDADNMASMFTLFSYLKSRFDFILIVSHIDALKDIADKTIEIKQDGNFSKVIFE